MLAKQKNKQQVKCKLKKGDEVIVLSGRSKGKTGKIDRVDRKHDRVFLQGVHMTKRHARPNMQNQEGGIVDVVVPLSFSKVALLDAKSKKASRIGYKITDKTKTRIAKKSGAVLA